MALQNKMPATIVDLLRGGPVNPFYTSSMLRELSAQNEFSVSKTGAKPFTLTETGSCAKSSFPRPDCDTLSHYLDVELVQRMALIMPNGLSTLGKRDYEKLAAAVRDMRAGFRQAVAQDGGPYTDELMEIVIARLGLVLARENSEFNSMLFDAECKGTKA